jgi:exopolysaccharide biosynthesis glucuronosyltransferase PssE
MPFDRMIVAVDRWAAEAGRTDVVAQIGESELTPEALESFERVVPAEFERLCAEAELLIAHAGMGSILTALQHGTPVLVMPRRGALRETRSDHQVATAKALAAQGRVLVAMDEHELVEKLHDLGPVEASPVISADASPELIDAVGSFVAARSPRWRALLGRL